MSYSHLRSFEITDPREILKDVPWEDYHTAKVISDNELKFILKYDKKPAEEQARLLDEDGPSYVVAFMSVLRNTKKEQVLQYVVALLDDMVTADPSRADLFHAESQLAKGGAGIEPYSIFVLLLERTDWFLQEKASRLLAAVLNRRPDKERSFLASWEKLPAALEGSSSSEISGWEGGPAEQAVFSFMHWLISQLRRPSNNVKSVPTSVKSLSSLLRERGVRRLFHRSGGIPLLAPLLRSAAQGTMIDIQLVYEACLCVWLLSYIPECAKAIKDCAVPRYLVGVVRANVKEKVTRVALLALKNLLNTRDVDVTAEVVEEGLPKLVQIRLVQNWEDEDVIDVLQWLDDRVKTGIEVLSNYDKYKKEILSGRLDWGPMHTEEQFWKQNVGKFEEKDFNIVRLLLRMLEVSREVRTLAVGCHDVGQFVSHHPLGRSVVSDLRGKEIVMEHMRHSDPEVQKNALLCVQKIMLGKDKLDFLTASA